MNDDILTCCPSCGAPGKTTHYPADEDGAECWTFQCGDGARCGWEWLEHPAPITPRTVVESMMRGIEHLRGAITIAFKDDLDPLTPMHAREIWRLAALKTGATEAQAMTALLRPTSPSMDYTLWALYIGSEEVYFVGEAATAEEATAMLKGMLL